MDFRDRMMVKRKRVGGYELEALGGIADSSDRRQVSSQVYLICQNGSAFETPHKECLGSSRICRASSRVSQAVVTGWMPVSGPKVPPVRDPFLAASKSSIWMVIIFLYLTLFAKQN